jgi:putative membrane protein
MTGTCVVAGVPAVIGLAEGTSLGTALGRVLPFAALLVLGTAAVEFRRRRTTRYRVSAERVEWESGLLVRQRRSLHRNRIRSVDVIAGPLLRMFGLARVSIGSGERASSLVLGPVTRLVAEDLRTSLLHRGGATGAADMLLAQFNPAWVRYAPLSPVAALLNVGVYGVVLNIADLFGFHRVFEWVSTLFRGVQPATVVVIVVVLAVAFGVISSLGLVLEMWWAFRLERDPSGTLRLRRGLLTTRSFSVEENRLRGIEVVEPFGLRMAGAARVDAVTIGTPGRSGNRTGRMPLLPAAPRDVAERVTAAVLREPGSLTRAAPLVRHPVAARSRRLRRAAAVTLAIEALLLLSGGLIAAPLLHVGWISALLLVPVAVLLALGAYRGLRHGLVAGHVVVRSGVVRRATVVLQRRGIIGWTVTQSVFQRRASLLTLTATTAAGAGGYSIRDVDSVGGIDFAEAAAPGLLTPFLLPLDLSPRPHVLR